jgi:hypothetical protein
MSYQLIRFAAALSLGGVLTAACGSSSTGGSTNPDASSGTGAATATGGGTGNGGSATGNGGATSGNGGAATGNGGAATGNGGTATGNGGNAGNAGAGGAGALTCPAQQPNDGDPCTARGNCPYGNQTCSCVRAGAGAQRTFLCFNPPDGGVNPGGDAGVPAACAHTPECATGVCCGLRRGATTGRCLSAANCTRFGGTELP